MCESLCITDEQIEQIKKLFGDDVFDDIIPSTFIKACVNTVLDEYIFPTAPIFAGDYPYGESIHLWNFRIHEGEVGGTARSHNLRPWEWLPSKTKEEFSRHLDEVLEHEGRGPIPVKREP